MCRCFRNATRVFENQDQTKKYFQSRPRAQKETRIRALDAVVSSSVFGDLHLRDGQETGQAMRPRQAEGQLRGVLWVSAREAETQLRNVHAVPARQRVPDVLPVQPVSARQNHVRLRDLQRVRAR
jgi:hypothetical protein